MVHRGEILKKAVKEAGISINAFAKKLGYERSYIYRLFNKPNLDLDILIKAGKILYHDFSSEVTTLKQDQNHIEGISKNFSDDNFSDKNNLLSKIIRLQEEIIKLQKENSYLKSQLK